jgi:hemerythrin-like domain-containing protein
MPFDPLDKLAADHRSALQVLQDIKQTSESLVTSEFAEQTFARFIEAVDFIDGEVRTHNMQEEEFLFPELEKTLPAQGPMHVMRAEHHQLYTSYAGLQELISAVRQSKDDQAKRIELAEKAKVLVNLLTNHIYKEDNILFPMARRMLTPEQLERIALGIQKK